MLDMLELADRLMTTHPPPEGWVGVLVHYGTAMPILTVGCAAYTHASFNLATALEGLMAIANARGWHVIPASLSISWYERTT